MLSRHAAAPHPRRMQRTAEPRISPSPGTPGDGDEGLFPVYGRALTLTLARSTGRGNQNLFRAVVLASRRKQIEPRNEAFRGCMRNPGSVVRTLCWARVEIDFSTSCPFLPVFQFSIDAAVRFGYHPSGWSADRIRFRRSFVPACCLFSFHPSRLSGPICRPLSLDLESKNAGPCPHSLK